MKFCIQKFFFGILPKSAEGKILVPKRFSFFAFGEIAYMFEVTAVILSLLIVFISTKFLCTSCLYRECIVGLNIKLQIKLYFCSLT